MPGEETDTVIEHPNTGGPTDAVATTTSSEEEEGYSGDYFSEESENENVPSSGEETHVSTKVKLRRRGRSSNPPSVPSSVVWPDTSDGSTHEHEVPPFSHADGRPEDNKSDTTLEETLGEQCQHPCCLRPFSDSDQGQQHPYRCACGPPYSRGSESSASEQRIGSPSESFFNERHSNELERFLRLVFQSPRRSMRSLDNNGEPHASMVINTAETHYQIWDPQPSSHAIISGFICYRALPRTSSTNELTWLSIEARTTFGNNTDSKYFMLLENTTMNEATFQRSCNGNGQSLSSRLPQQRAASSPFYNFLSPVSVLDLQVKPITSQYGTPVCTFLLIFPVGDPFFFPAYHVGYFSRKIKIECKGHVNIRESDGCTSIAQVSQTAEVVVNVKRTKVMRNGVWIHFEAPV